MQEKAKGWDIKEIEYLQGEIEKCVKDKTSLSRAFKNTAEHTNRNQNSVRNFYYTDLRKRMLNDNVQEVKRRENMDFDAFTDDEVTKLVKYIIKGTSQGKSIRQCANELSQGNTKLILRYQNKYRSVLKRHREVVESVLVELKEEGFDYVSPYKREHTKCERAYEAIKGQVDLSEFIKQVNVLYDNGVLDSNMRKNLIYTKAMAEGEYNKIQKSTMLYEFYAEKINKIIENEINLEDVR